ncbi:hypothetical protein GCM10020358_47480 [Amorphoplanes nipponensis]
MMPAAKTRRDAATPTAPRAATSSNATEPASSSGPPSQGSNAMTPARSPEAISTAPPANAYGSSAQPPSTAPARASPYARAAGDAGQCEQQSHPEAEVRRAGPGGAGREHREQADGQQHRAAGQRGRTGGGRRPDRAAAPGALGDRLDDVVVLQLGPVVPGRHQVQHLAVAHTLRKETLGGRQRDAVGAAQQPAAVLLAVVGQALAGVPEHLGEQLGQGDVLRQRHVDAALRGADRDACQPDGHDRVRCFMPYFPSMVTRLRN